MRPIEANTRYLEPISPLILPKSRYNDDYWRYIFNIMPQNGAGKRHAGAGIPLAGAVLRRNLLFLPHTGTGES